ncbi:MAG TPA: phosphoglucomutase/phosphomannomutase family protein [Pyrinomonadaceae bacterium]|jgi:phosphomannomutase|nr:phosphoglucomutase/phosphomannomutase family protein [Pyrinomonadaceae bacterium]
MTNLAPIKFGTDGWRAVIARDYTFANLERVAQAYADYLSGAAVTDGPALIVVGYDRRFLSEFFAQRAAELMVGNKFTVSLFKEAAPTPLISWAVKQLKAAGGIVITASHNPADFNGFKIKAPWGGSAAPETTSAVEKLVDVNPPKRGEVASDTHSLIEPAIESYKQQIASYLDLDRLRKAPSTVIVDPMHGAGGNWVESFLKGADLRVETIRAFRDPLFGGVNPEPIDSNLGALKQRVIESKALVGLATDGDADRVGAVNELGQTMTMHDVVPLILLHLVRFRKMTGGVVRTFSQSVLLKRIAAAHNLKLYETPIGFKYIADLMLKDDILIGAEESGGIGVKGHIPERDGILNSLLFLETIIAAGKPPSEMLRDLHREFGEFHFRRRDLRVDQSVGQRVIEELQKHPPQELAGYTVAGVETTDGTKLLFDDESWLLFRPSGTEPMLRVYAEATTTAKAEALLSAGEALASEAQQKPDRLGEAQS